MVLELVFHSQAVIQGRTWGLADVSERNAEYVWNARSRLPW